MVHPTASSYSRWAWRLRGPFLAILVLLTLLAVGGVTPESVSAAQNIDPSSCGGAGFPNCPALPANVTIGANSCTAISSCISLGDGAVIGHDSCNAGSACPAIGIVGSGQVGNGSCNSSGACAAAGSSGSVLIGDGSCNAINACQQAGATGGSAQVGDGSCNAFGACDQTGRASLSTVSIGDYSCNQAGQYAGNCTGVHADVGVCEFNDANLVPEECVSAPELTFTFVQHTDRGDRPYAPGTWARWAVTATVACLPGEDGPPIAVNSYPGTLNFTNDGIYDLGAILGGKTCRDTSGAEAPPPDSWPVVKIDRHRPTCDATPLLQWVPKNDPADSGQTYRRSFDVAAQDGALTGKTVLTVVLKSVQASGGTTSGLDIGTFDTSGRFEGRPGAIYALTWRVTDEAGWTNTCSAKVQAARN